jgi:hypothetical protein
MFNGPKQLLVRVRVWLTWPVVSALQQSQQLQQQSQQLQQSQHDFLKRAQWELSLKAAKNPLNSFGAKYFSQTDEDGLTLEIVTLTIFSSAVGISFISDGATHHHQKPSSECL